MAWRTVTVTLHARPGRNQVPEVLTELDELIERIRALRREVATLYAPAPGLNRDATSRREDPETVTGAAVNADGGGPLVDGAPAKPEEADTVTARRDGHPTPGYRPWLRCRCGEAYGHDLDCPAMPPLYKEEPHEDDSTR